MELQALIKAHEYVAEKGGELGVQRVIIVTDSLYLFNNYRNVATWRGQGWKTLSGRTVENSDLWKRFLTVQGKVGVRTDIIWQKGKKTPTLKIVGKSGKIGRKVTAET